eukprot:gene10751-12720_t
MPRIKHVAQKNRGRLVVVAADKGASYADSIGEAAAAVTTTTTSTRKPHRYRAGTVALRQIKHLQKNANHTMFPQKSFERVVRDILGSESAAPDVRITKNAVSALKEASEFLLTEVFWFAQLSAIVNRRVSITPADWRLAKITVTGQSRILAQMRDGIQTATVGIKL